MQLTRVNNVINEGTSLETFFCKSPILRTAVFYVSYLNNWLSGQLLSLAEGGFDVFIIVHIT